MSERWRPMHSAPKGKQWDRPRILAYKLGRDGKPYIRIYTWDADEYAKKPRPFWRPENCYSKNEERDSQPVGWMPLPEV